MVTKFMVLGMLLLLGYGGHVAAQADYAYGSFGLPYFEVYTPSEYPGGQQNRSITQWDDGSILVANNEGMLQHSDNNWRVFGTEEIIFLSNLTRSKNNSSIVWVGSFGNVGYFEHSNTTLFSYRSLTNSLPDSLRNFSRVRSIHEFNSDVLYLSDLYVFRYDTETQAIGLAAKIYDAHPSDTAQIRHLKTWQNSLFVFFEDGTIIRLNDDYETERIINTGDINLIGVTAAAQWMNYLLLADSNEGLILFDGLSVRRFETPVHSFLIQNSLSDIAVFDGGHIAISTSNGGTVVINKNGEFEYLLSSKSGLAEDIHESLYIDYHQDLWIAGNESITKVHTGVPVRHLNGRTFGFGDAVELINFNDRFYVASINGLYVQEQPLSHLLHTSPDDLFTQISPTITPFWGFEVVDGQLWAGGNAGIYRVNENELELLFDLEAYNLFPFGNNKILVTTYNGVGLLVKQDDVWRYEGVLEAASFFNYFLAVTSDRTFWSGGVQGQLVKVSYDSERNEFSEKRYGEADGLPSGDVYEPRFLNGEVIINSQNGFLKYDTHTGRLIPFDELNRSRVQGDWAGFLTVDDAGNYWSTQVSRDYRGLIKYEKTSQNKWERRVTEVEISPDLIGDFIKRHDQHLWVGSTQSILYQNLDKPFSNNQPEVYIWEIRSLFDQEILSSDGHPVEIKHDQRNISLILASSSHRSSKKNEFRYKVDGGSWSQWRSNPDVSLNNYFPGTYKFTAQTRDFVHQVSEPVTYAITISAPWYLSNIAYSVYIFGFIAGIGFSVRTLSNYRIRRELVKMKLEESEKIIELDAMKNRFFANISHEFRTPLTISYGLINKLIQKSANGEDVAISKLDLQIVNRNMMRLNDMVNQIMDLTKSDEKTLDLNSSYYKADNLVSISVESFRSLAEYHGHNFVFEANADEAILLADRPKIEIIINNLISNAIKFTPDGGSIIIKTRISENQYKLTVQDSGSGIPVGEEEAIFERFHRIKREDADYVEGMGVGLELSRTFAQLHSGDITVDASYENGARFTLTLPIVEISESDVTPLTDTLIDNKLYVEKVPEKLTTEARFDILLVEDNEDMTEYVKNILAELGSIKTAKNGKEALQILKKYKPDIIVTDLMMPVMGGLELVENLKNHAEWNTVPVMVLTAKALEEDKLHMLRIGVVDYITKPFSPEQLVLKMKNLLDYYTRRKAIRLKVKADEIPESNTLSEKAAAFISKNLSNPNISVDSLAAEFSQSRRSFYRNLQLETGMTAGEFIREVRLTSARALIASDKNIRLDELAAAVGYKSATSFRKMYVARFGEHPLE